MTTQWKNTTILNEINANEILKMKQMRGKDIVTGSPSIVSQLAQLELIDEYIFVLQPIISGNGKRFFETHKLNKQIKLSLYDKKFFKSGVVALYYRGVNSV
jgi:dihydrofolate reductase